MLQRSSAAAGGSWPAAWANFVFGASSSLTDRTGILRLKLSAEGVEGARLARALAVRHAPAG